MVKRHELQAILEDFVDNVYYRPPSNVQMMYPCIVYDKSGKSRSYGNNDIYREKQQYQATVIDPDPDSTIADDLEKELEYCTIGQYFTVDNLNHTVLTIYY